MKHWLDMACIGHITWVASDILESCKSSCCMFVWLHISRVLLVTGTAGKGKKTVSCTLKMCYLKIVLAWHGLWVYEKH